MSTLDLMIVGAGGHAKVAMEAWRSAGGNISALHDDDPQLRGREILGAVVRGTLAEAIGSDAPLHLAIGDNRVRERLADGVEDGRFPPVVHAFAIISASAFLSPGVLICAGAIIQAEALVGRHTIINSRALVEHDVRIGDFVHIAPGVLLGGGVRIGDGALIGIGATIMPNITVGAGAVVGAGALVSKPVAPGAVMVGVPARNVSVVKGL